MPNRFVRLQIGWVESWCAIVSLNASAENRVENCLGLSPSGQNTILSGSQAEDFPLRYACSTIPRRAISRPSTAIHLPRSLQ